LIASFGTNLRKCREGGGDPEKNASRKKENTVLRANTKSPRNR